MVAHEAAEARHKLRFTRGGSPHGGDAGGAVPRRAPGALLWCAGLCCLALAGSRLALAEDPSPHANPVADVPERIVPAAPGFDDQRKGDARWTVAVEAVVLGRSNGSANQVLISRVPGTQSFSATAIEAGTEAFNSEQFRQGMTAGPKLAVAYQGDAGYGWEAAYFQVLNLHDSKTIGPEDPLNWYVMKAPGTFPSFWQTQDFPSQGMTWSTTTNLYNAEVNATSRVSKRLRLLAGFRWIQLNDSLVGSLTPPDRNEPAWKAAPYPCGSGLHHPTLVEIDSCAGAAGPPVSGYPPFWVTAATNNLFGLQAGAEGVVFERGGLSLGAALKAGVYGNRATQSAWVSMQKQVYYASATRNAAAFVGEGRVELKYLVASGLALKLGYELLWLDKLALAPGQIAQTYSGINPASEAATGVNTGSNVLYQGATLGFEYSF